MAISWTKEWTAADDGTVVSGADLKNIQDDIGGGVTTDATTIQSIPVDAPVVGDDDSLLFYDNGNTKFDYVTREAVLATTAPTVDIDGGTMDDVQVDGATATGMLYVNDSNDVMSQLADQGTAGQILTSAGAGANPTWETALHSSEEFTSSGTFTVPSGVYTFWVTLIGGGAGGATAVDDDMGGGGGGASIVLRSYRSTPTTEFTVTVGAAAASNTAGNDSVFDDGGDNEMTAGGGAVGVTDAGGVGGTATFKVAADLAGSGTTGGSPVGGAAGGYTYIVGGAGGIPGGNDGGGGGASALGTGGAGGTWHSGAPGAGTGYGSGGGGVGADSNGVAGGAGAAGYCIVYW